MSTFVVSSGMQIEYASLSRQGGRENNEDACGYCVTDAGSFFVVSDGAGGHGGGEVASETAIRTALSAYSSVPDFSTDNISKLMAQVSSAVRYGQSLSDRLKKMSATITGLFINSDGSKALWAHIGDTRLYLFRRGDFTQLTKDHSIVQRYIDAGLVDKEGSRHHKDRNMLFAALGMPEEVEVEVTGFEFDLEEGDAFLLCTDGLWELVNEEEMQEQLIYSCAAQEWLLRMEHLLEKRAGHGHDNYSGMAIWLGTPNEMTIPWNKLHVSGDQDVV